MPPSNKNRAEVSGLVLSKHRRTTQNGKPALRLKVRSRHFGTMDGEREEFFDPIDVEVRGDYADVVDGEVDPGTVIDSVGRLEVRKRPVKANGRTVYERKRGRRRQKTYWSTIVVARRVTPLSATDAGGGNEDGAHSDADQQPQDDASPTAEGRAADGRAAIAGEGREATATSGERGS